jgi:hypothetical protein
VLVSVECFFSFVANWQLHAKQLLCRSSANNEDPGAYKPDRGGNSSAFANEKADVLLLCHVFLMVSLYLPNDI